MVLAASAWFEMTQVLGRQGKAYSFDDGQDVAGIYRRTCGRRYFLYDSPFWRLDFVLHFHRFDYDDALAGFDGGIFRDQQAHHAAGHGSQDFPGSLFVSGSFLARAQRARIAQLDHKAGTAYPQVEIGGGLLTLNFVGASIDQQGQNVAARDDRVDMDRLSVHATRPSICGFFKLQPVRFASRFVTHDDLINHTISAALPSALSVSSWMEAKPAPPNLFNPAPHSCPPAKLGRARQTFQRQSRRWSPAF